MHPRLYSPAILTWPGGVRLAASLQAPVMLKSKVSSEGSLWAG